VRRSCDCAAQQLAIVPISSGSGLAAPRHPAQDSAGGRKRHAAVTVAPLHDERQGARHGGRADDSQPVKVQRKAAWRTWRAIEIKNPLTPIQLSAQRIRRRLGPRLSDPADQRVLDDCVETIAHQVEGLKLLVNEFSNFARSRQPVPDD
jgi:two-component system nitrogen regulation sensor histidine kinase NtrY